MKLYNTLTRSKESFVPTDPKRVTMYVCGPTVYNYAHIGNARPAVVFDVLYRLLKHRFAGVVYARNITDIDDKIMAAAAESGVPIDQITRKFTDIYHADTAALNVLSPDVEPRATDHLPPMIAMIERLIDQGHAYEKDGHVLFDVESYDDYGRLSNRTLDELVAGARVAVADYKKHAGDFILWKPSSDDQIGWDSPWGRGRPGWHLECSVMAADHLGETIDIHGGGIDLVFPHHENEVAQSNCTHGAPLARFWMHNGFLTMDETKMSKSLGNFLTIHELLQDHAGEALRLALLTAHYRQPLDWSDDAIDSARRNLDRVYRALDKLRDVNATPEPPAELVAALEDDLNTPKALSVVASFVNLANVAATPQEQAAAKAGLLGSGSLLGLFQADPQEWLQAGASQLDEGWLNEQVRLRDEARKNRDFGAADRIRDELAKLGVVIEDGPEGSVWRAL